MRTGQVVAKQDAKCCGNATKAVELYGKLLDFVKAMLDDSTVRYFIPVVLACTSQKLFIVRGLFEFFWDTTNTFHLPWGEMTMTPLDFSILMGLSFGGVDLPYTSEFEPR